MADFNDDFDDDSVDEQGQVEPTRDSNPIKQLRAQLRAAQKQLKEQSQIVSEYETFKAERDAQVKAEATGKIFEQMGLNPVHAKLFMATNSQDATAEAIAKFALDYGLGVPADKEAELEKVAEGPKFIPVSPGGAVPVRNRLSREQFEALKKTDMTAAAKAVEENRVDGFTASWDGTSAEARGSNL